jgi:hypothetical protein
VLFVLAMKLTSDVLTRLARKGLSVRATHAVLTQQGYKLSVSTVARRLRSLSASRTCCGSKNKKHQRKLSDRVDRYMFRQVHVHGVGRTAELHQDLQQQGFGVSKKTVYRTLKANPSLALKRPRQRMFMTEAHRQQRLAWAIETFAAQIDWSAVYFADEKVWFMDGPVGRRPQWTSLLRPPPVVQRTGTRNRSVSVWGAFSLERVPCLKLLAGPLNSDSYCQTIASRLVSRHSDQPVVLYHDRHSAHHSRKTNAWMAANHVESRLFPPKDADINPMENLWSIVSGQVFSGTKTYKNEASLYKAVKAAWRRVQYDRKLRANLVKSMRKRLEQVVERKGGQADF